MPDDDSLVARYENGATIRDLQRSTGMSYWMTREALLEGGAQMRSTGRVKGKAYGPAKPRTPSGQRELPPADHDVDAELARFFGGTHDRSA